jgi:hypothetical protein
LAQITTEAFFFCSQLWLKIVDFASAFFSSVGLAI